jgi:uncharacterized repeat protein (TIGR01451 family)
MAGGLLGASSALAAPDLTVLLSLNFGFNVTGGTSEPIVAGATNTYVAIVRNGGDTAAANVFVLTTLPPSWSFVTFGGPDCFFQAADRSPGAFSLLRGERALCAAHQVAAGATKTFSFTVRAPATLSGQKANFIFRAVVDPDNLVPESNENNNTAVLELQTAAELVADWQNSPTAIVGGDNANYRPRVRNIGDRDAENVIFLIRIPAAMNYRFDNGDTPCFLVPIQPGGADTLRCQAPRIPAGGEATLIFQVRVEATQPEGLTTQLMLAVDPQNLVPERNKSNNAVPLEVTISAPADLLLAVSSLQVVDSDFTLRDADHHSSTRRITTATLALTVRNNGPGRSPATRVNVNWDLDFEPRASMDALCPLGAISVNDRCIPGVRPAECFGIANVPVLMPGESTPIHCAAVRLRRDDQPLFGHAELDRDALVLDPNRDNNVVDLRPTK